MEELFSMGICDSTIRSMIEINPDIRDISKDEIEIRKIILGEIKCSDNMILNIISSNPKYLSKSIEDIKKILEYLFNNGFKSLNILLDSNPYILNLEPYEIDNYINDRRNNGEELKDIIDDLDSNPYLFNEI